MLAIKCLGGLIAGGLAGFACGLVAVIPLWIIGGIVTGSEHEGETIANGVGAFLFGGGAIVGFVIPIVTHYHAQRAKEDESASADRLREILARLEGRESSWTLYDAGHDSLNKRQYHSDGSEYYDRLHGTSVLDAGREESEQHVLDDTEAWKMKVTFVQSTPDGLLTTTVYSESRICRIAIDLQGTGLLEECYFFTDEHADLRGATKLGAKVNRFAVRYVRDWVRRRVVHAFEAAKTQRAERRESERRSREKHLSSMREKYLP